MADFIFLGSKITADGDFSHEIKRCLLLGRKAMTNLDSILNSRDITLSTKVHLVKAMVFPVVRYGCERWTIKKAECRRIDAFELLCWRRLESPLDCKEIKPVYPKGDQSWVFIGRTDVEAETPILWPPDAKSWLIGKKPWCWERLRAGGEGEDRRKDGWMASPTQWTWVWVCDGQGSLAYCSPRGRKESDTLSDWTELNWIHRKVITYFFQWLSRVQPFATP